ncbi:FAD-dependent oxidoreductase [Ligilactobacillus ceti]|uniref:CoA-disulfide reductase n=1 Tax=Ligilactobacillus ceti DSM 22408 TaxID=1122146 RepID=A0A0R2KHJ9_9LACO|nr:FAD-dependent oxidoreductase [Ligilactobacillus ceti]KRN88815.1 coA-disulfide reductase [Ligilactobacillus ceti DSM 22408]
MKKKLVIVGGVAGGMSAATRARRLNEDLDITVYEKGDYVSFANCGLPYHISGTIPEEESLLVQTPQALKDRFNINALVAHEVIDIDPENKTVTVKHNNETFTDSYDSLVLSPGAAPFVPPIKGLADADNVHTLVSIMDLEDIMHQLNDTEVKNAVVIGAGFIGVEVAENLAQRGLNVHLVEKAPHILPPVDIEMATYLQNVLRKNKVNVLTNVAAQEFQNNGHKIILDDGSFLEADLVVMSVGVRPRIALAQKAGVQVTERGSIIVDEHYKTNVADIYAVGDAIAVKNQISGQLGMIALASPANREGRQVADNIIGHLPHKNRGSIGTSIVGVFGFALASTGLSERAVRALDIEPGILHVSGPDHAKYYPGAKGITLKIIFDQTTGKIYGAQAFGPVGADRRIDVIAAAIKGNLTIQDLPEMELSYSPPYGVAKDIVNMAGYAGMNLLEGYSHNVQWYDLPDKMKDGAIVLDVRAHQDFIKMGHLPNAINIPLNELRARVGELDKEQSYLIACYSGQQSYIAERFLVGTGFKDVKNFDGGYAVYNVMFPDLLIK